jgi:hypothetical protein
MKQLWLILYLLPSLSFAELSVIHDELKDGSKMEVAHVDAGAVPVTLTDMFKAAWNDGAIRNTIEKGAVTVDNHAPLMHADNATGVNIAGDGIEFKPYAFNVERLIDFKEKAFFAPVTVNVPEKILQPVGDSLKELVSIIKDIKTDTCAAGEKVKKDSVILFWVIVALAGVAVCIACWLHGRNKGHQATIAALKQVNNGNGNLA